MNPSQLYENFPFLTSSMYQNYKYKQSTDVSYPLSTQILHNSYQQHHLSSNEEETKPILFPMSTTYEENSNDSLSSDRNYNLRKGKWTPEEEAYTAKLISLFNQGKLPIPPGTTLRNLLSEKLKCDPMRITKKFAGTSAIGKQIYQPSDSLISSSTVTFLSKDNTENQNIPEIFMEELKELKELETTFLSKLASKKKSISQINNNSSDYNTSDSNDYTNIINKVLNVSPIQESDNNKKSNTNSNSNSSVPSPVTQPLSENENYTDNTSENPFYNMFSSLLNHIPSTGPSLPLNVFLPGISNLHYDPKIINSLFYNNLLVNLLINNNGSQPMIPNNSNIQMMPIDNSLPQVKEEIKPMKRNSSMSENFNDNESHLFLEFISNVNTKKSNQNQEVVN